MKNYKIKNRFVRPEKPVKIVRYTMLHMIFQYDSELILIQRILIGFEAMLKKSSFQFSGFFFISMCLDCIGMKNKINR